MKPAQEFYSWYVVACVLNVFLSYTPIMLNIITIHAIRKTLSLSKPLKTLLLSRAVSDLGVGLTAQPLFVAIRVMELKQIDIDSRTYYTTSIAFLVSANLFSFVSLFLVVFLITDRFLAIRLYLRYKELVTHKRVVAVVISIWVFSAIMRLWIPRNIIYIVFGILTFVFALTVLLFSFKTYSTARWQINQIQEMELPAQQVAQNGEMANVERLRKFAMAAIYVCLVFMFCYLPNMCILWTMALTSEPVTSVIEVYTWTLLFFNSSLIPLIYCWKMRHSTRCREHPTEYMFKSQLNEILVHEQWTKRTPRINVGFSVCSFRFYSFEKYVSCFCFCFV